MTDRATIVDEPSGPSETVGFETILNTFPHPILVLDGDDAVTYANPGAEQFSPPVRRNYAAAG